MVLSGDLQKLVSDHIQNIVDLDPASAGGMYFLNTTELNMMLWYSFFWHLIHVISYGHVSPLVVIAVT